MSEVQPSSNDAAPSVAGPSTSAPSPGPGTTFAGPKTKLNPITMPSMEQIMQEDAMNNCVVKTILSGVMGGIAGVAFGLFTASIENSGGVSSRVDEWVCSIIIVSTKLGTEPCMYPGWCAGHRWSTQRRGQDYKSGSQRDAHKHAGEECVSGQSLPDSRTGGGVLGHLLFSSTHHTTAAHCLFSC